MDTPLAFSERVRNTARRLIDTPAALAGLYDLVAVRLVRYACTITRNQHDAEDALQNALVKVAADPRPLYRADQPWSYLLRMVRNEALVTVRRSRRWKLMDSLTDLFTRRSVDTVEQEETYREVWLALRSLPIEQSEVVVLKIWESMTFAQIGEILDVSPATVASRYRYAMRKLSTILQPAQSLDPPESAI